MINTDSLPTVNDGGSSRVIEAARKIFKLSSGKNGELHKRDMILAVCVCNVCTSTSLICLFVYISVVLQRIIDRSCKENGLGLDHDFSDLLLISGDVGSEVPDWRGNTVFNLIGNLLANGKYSACSSSQSNTISTKRNEWLLQAILQVCRNIAC